MNIVIDIKPEVQAELGRVDISAYAANLLEEAAQIPAGSNTLRRSVVRDLRALNRPPVPKSEI